MISLGAYRARIGAFQQKNKIISKQGLFSQQGRVPGIYLSKMFYSNIMICLGILIVANMSFLKVNLLKQHGDVETNPGPTYSIIKSVTVTCHQGNIDKFGKTAGRQCLCNALYLIACSTVKRIGLWSKHDLDIYIYINIYYI